MEITKTMETPNQMIARSLLSRRGVAPPPKRELILLLIRYVCISLVFTLYNLEQTSYTLLSIPSYTIRHSPNNSSPVRCRRRTMLVVHRPFCADYATNVTKSTSMIVWPHANTRPLVTVQHPHQRSLQRRESLQLPTSYQDTANRQGHIQKGRKFRSINTSKVMSIVQQSPPLQNQTEVQEMSTPE